MGSSTLLGPDHPLARAESRMRTLRAQFAVTVVLGLAMLASRRCSGRPRCISGRRSGRLGGALVAHAVRARQPARAALELIASGREELPLASSRASAPGCAIAATAAASRARSTSSAPTRRRREWWSPVYADRDAVHAARDELHEIARLLRELPSVRARGVALVTRLVRDGATSPLYQGPGAAAARGARPHPARAHPALTLARPRGAASGPRPRLAGCPRRSRSLPAAPTRCAGSPPSSASSASRPRCSCGAGWPIRARHARSSTATARCTIRSRSATWPRPAR